MFFSFKAEKKSRKCQKRKDDLQWEKKPECWILELTTYVIRQNFEKSSSREINL